MRLSLHLEERAVGVARFIRCAGKPRAAEIAATVIDSWQGRGLGLELLARLSDRARQEGIGRFTALVAAICSLSGWLLLMRGVVTLAAQPRGRPPWRGWPFRRLRLLQTLVVIIFPTGGVEMSRITIPLPPGPARAWASVLGDPRAWMLRGACRGADTELFFPIAAAGCALQQVSSAKAVCVRCEVRASCLSYALETAQHGIWGGTTGDERIAMRARPASSR